MARLTWDNVAAPNFRGISDNYRVMSELLGRAAQSGQNALDIFSNAQEGNADRAIALRLAGVQDPTQFDASAILGQEGSRASLGMINDVRDRFSTLLNNQGQRIRNNTGQYVLDESKRTSEARQAFAPIYAQSAAQAAAGFPNVGRQTLENNPEVMGKLSPTEIQNAYSDLQTLGTGRLDYRKESESYAEKQRREAAAQSGLGIAQDILWRSGTTGEAQQLLAYDWPKLGIDQRKAVLSEIQKVYPDIIAPLGSSDGSPGGGGGGFGSGAGFVTDTAALTGLGGVPAPRVINYEAAGRGFSVPDTVQTQGQMVDFGRSINQSNTKKFGSPGSSATGTYQLTRTTREEFARDLFGDSWRDMPLDFETEDKIAERVFNTSKQSNEAIRGRWDSLNKLSDSEVEQLRQMPWEQARVVIARLESSTDLSGLNRPTPSQRRSNSRGVDTYLSDALMRGELDSLGRDYAELATSDKETIELANELTGEKGKLSGMNRDDVGNRIASIAREAGVSPALAARILTRAYTGKPQTSAVGDFFRTAGNYLSAGLYNPYEDGMFDYNKIEQEIKRVSRENPDDPNSSPIVREIEQQLQNRGKIDTLIERAVLQQQIDQQKQFIAQARSQPRLRGNLPRYEARLNFLLDMLDESNKQNTPAVPEREATVQPNNSEAVAPPPLPALSPEAFRDVLSPSISANGMINLPPAQASSQATVNPAAAIAAAASGDTPMAPPIPQMSPGDFQTLMSPSIRADGTVGVPATPAAAQEMEQALRGQLAQLYRQYTMPGVSVRERVRLGNMIKELQLKLRTL